MTQVERLIRNLCETRRLQIVEEERTALKKFKEADHWDELTGKVQRLITRHRRLATEKQAVERAITRAGYHTYNLSGGNRSFMRTDRDESRARVRTSFETRRARVQKLRTDSTVDALGKAAADAKPLLTTLQTALAKV